MKTFAKANSRDFAKKCLRNPDRAPDIGEPRLHPTAGATVVGARKFLIAYNINLNTPDLEIAKRIAKTIRFSSGGLRYVKAMGVDLRARNLAQVSINLTDFEQTPIHRVFEMVKREAERYGVAIVGSEIVGLIPRRAIEMTAEFYLQLENFSPAQVLENRMEDSLGEAAGKGPRTSRRSRSRFSTPSREPTAAPGGGSVAALAGALGASLGQMVAGLSRKKKSLAAYAEPLSEAAERISSGFASARRRPSTATRRPTKSVMAAHKLAARDAGRAAAPRRGDSACASRARSKYRSKSRARPPKYLKSSGNWNPCRQPVYAVRRPRGPYDGRGSGSRRAGKRGHQSRIHYRSPLCRAAARSEARSLASRIAESPVTAGR